MGNTSHCAETLFAEDHQTVGCLVEVKGRVQNPEEAPFSLQLEIHGRGGDKRTIEPGARIHEWHFWKDGEAVAVASGMSTNAEHYALYESATGHLVEELPAPPEENMLPQWAKSRTQIDDESVPMSPSLTEERARWLARVLREIQKIQPGMHRRDLIPTFTTEGGLSNRLRRTYVFAECPILKVDIRFSAADHTKNVISEEDPLDTIDSVSAPYLGWSVYD